MTEEKVVKLSGSEEYSVTGTCLKDIEVRTFESKTTWIENGVERLNYKKLVIDEMVDEGFFNSGSNLIPCQCQESM